MRLSKTLTAYIGRQFFYSFGAVFASLLALIFVFDLIELLRRTASHEQVGLALNLELALLKLPTTAQTMLPFAVLFGTMLTYWRLTRSQELVVARAAGVSVWQFLFPALLVALLIGVFRMAVFNPVGSVMTQRFEAIESQIFRGRTSLLAVSDTGLWLRQATGQDHSILHAQGVAQQNMQLFDVTVYLFEGQDHYIGRIDAKQARLDSGYWLIDDASIVMGEHPQVPVHHDHYRLATDLTIENIQDSFAAPETMSFWELPAFIEVLERAGFSAIRHRLYLHSLLATPVLLAAMVLVAAVFSLRMIRRGGTLSIAAIGIFSGFLIYFLSDLVFALGLSQRLPVTLAAWTPAIVASLFGLAILLHVEDG